MMDVRGTLIHPTLDEPLSQDLVETILGLLASGIIIALNTATSIQSLQNLIISPLLYEGQQGFTNSQGKFILYVDSSTKAYSLNSKGEVVALNSFPFLEFTEQELEVVLQSIELASEEYGLGSQEQKLKPGQVNFYCGGSWIERMKIASFMNSVIHGAGFLRVFAVVPSAKETIDIAVCRKDRGVRDLIDRFSIQPEELMIIGDSLQEGGPDYDMVLAAPGSLGVQVGEHVPAFNTHHVTTMPQTHGVQETLTQLLKVVRSRT